MFGTPLQWYDMDTAPKDGSVIWGYFHNGKVSESTAHIIPMKWNSWGNGAWYNATSRGYLSSDPIMWTYQSPPPDQLQGTRIMV